MPESKSTVMQNKKMIIAIVLVVIVLIVGLIMALFLLSRNSNSNKTSNTSNNQTNTQSTNQNQTPNISQVYNPHWQLTQDGWQATGTLTQCDYPLLIGTPVDLSQVTSILYPGQTRGGNYKPHGGFRFDNIHDNVVEVKAPMDAVVVQGARYLVDGEIQYTFDFITPCGIMYRLGHFRELSPKYQALADKFPEAMEGDSRTTQVNPQVSVRNGEIIATKVGITAGGNTFFDYGVYDLRSKNLASQDPVWAANPIHDPILAQHAICWLNLLGPANSAIVNSLPAGDPTSGKTSDYCK